MRATLIIEIILAIVLITGSLLFLLTQSRIVFVLAGLALQFFYFGAIFLLSKKEQLTGRFVLAGILSGLLMFINITWLMYGIMHWPGRIGMLYVSVMISPLLFLTIYLICTGQKEQENSKHLLENIKLRYFASLGLILLSYLDFILYGFN